eukprot:6484820-Amphidinium_carterae.2
MEGLMPRASKRFGCLSNVCKEQRLSWREQNSMGSRRAGGPKSWVSSCTSCTQKSTVNWIWMQRRGRVSAA